MSWYTPWTREEIDAADLASLKGKLEHAQAEIKRLSGDPVRPIDIPAAVREAELLATEWHEWCERVRVLEQPPKDLSDPYPKDGPNVRNQNAHDALSKWLKGVDERLTALSETVAKNRKDHETLTELVALQAGQAEDELWMERRKGQRREGPDERRNVEAREHRHGSKGMGRRIRDRRQP